MNLVIVESPAKAKTIQKYLGKSYTVTSSYGHVRDLPKSAIGVDTDGDFTPSYIIPAKAKKRVAELRKQAQQADAIYYATDEDREGEAIAWHLQQALKPKKSVDIHRIVFHEITKPAILAAVDNPREIDERLVNAQQARRVLDRLVGYELSPLIWRKVRYGLSAGRVQSVAVRLVVEREREITAFDPQEYWRVKVVTKTETGEEIEFEVSKEDNKKVDIPNKQKAQEIVTKIKEADLQVADIIKRRIKRKPAAPFITSTLQQEASRKLGFSVKRTMAIAQQLYEGIDIAGETTGLITYMRTDSFNLAGQALTGIKQQIKKAYGDKYTLAQPRTFKARKSSQEAHEAIRPTSFALEPTVIKNNLDRDQYRLYELIWQRTLACQMAEAELDQTAIDIQIDNLTLRANGQTIAFDGFMKVYIEGVDKQTDDDEAAEGDTGLLPEVKKGDSLQTNQVKPTQHFTKPPARYTEASLVKRLEAEGIGRPSTYAPTLATVESRGYIEKDRGRLSATDIGMLVTDFLLEHFTNIVDFEFTARIEERLDEIAAGQEDWVKMMRQFYNPFHETIEQKEVALKKEDVLKERVIGTDPKTGKEVVARHGRFGPFVQLGEWSEEDRKAKRNKPKRASLLKGTFFDTITLEEALKALSLPRSLGEYNGSEVIVTTGRFGPYFKIGDDNVSLPKDADPYEIKLDDELKSLIKESLELKKKMKEPIATLENDPKSGQPIEVRHGRYGPYISDGTTNASLPKNLDPEKVTSKEAIKLLAKKRQSPKRNWKKKSK